MSDFLLLSDMWPLFIKTTVKLYTAYYIVQCVLSIIYASEDEIERYIIGIELESRMGYLTLLQ